MADIIFEWDDRKAQQNEKKHGISFEEAQTAFYDEKARLSENHCAPITASHARSQIESPAAPPTTPALH